MALVSFVRKTPEHNIKAFNCIQLHVIFQRLLTKVNMDFITHCWLPDFLTQVFPKLLSP